MTIRRITATMLWIFVSLLLVSCAVDLAGTGTETSTKTATVAGVVLDTDGNPAAKTRVQLVPGSHSPIDGKLPDESLADTTGVSGVFSITVADSGLYNAEGLHLQKRSRFFVGKLSVDRDHDLGDMQLSAPGIISVPLGADGQGSAGSVYIQGTTIAAAFGAGDTLAVMDSVPSGVLPAAYLALSPGAPAPVKLADSVVVTAADTTMLNPFTDWKYGTRVVLNTTPTGADVYRWVVDFPLLVRLNAACGFRIEEFKSNGADLRFSRRTSSGSTVSLPYEIEEWNVAHNRAAVWVRVDTIRGNDSTQFITMHWGNESAEPVSNSSAVFQSSNDFAAVWHLGGADPLADATGNGNTLRDRGTEDSAGIAGGGRYFDGADSMIAADNTTLEPPSLTLSAWILRDAVQDSFAKIVNKGPIAQPHHSYSLELRRHSDVVGFQVAKSDSNYYVVESARIVPDSAWCHVVGTFDAQAGEGALYVNGRLRSTFVDPHPIEYFASSAHDLYLGTQEAREKPKFRGVIDEVRLSSVARSEYWTKLSHANQKEGSTFLRFER